MTASPGRVAFSPHRAADGTWSNRLVSVEAIDVVADRASVRVLSEGTRRYGSKHWAQRTASTAMDGWIYANASACLQHPSHRAR